MPLEHVACIVCGSSSSKPFVTKWNIGIVRCRNCGFGFTNPRPLAAHIHQRYSASYFWDEYLPAVGMPRGTYDPDFFWARHGPMLDLIARTHTAPGRLFEVGTGSGSFIKVASSVGWTVAGIEFSAEAAQFARERLELEVSQSAAEEFVPTGRAWDVVVMFEVLEHLLDPRAVLSTVLGMLRPGGLLVVSVPNLAALSRRFLGSEWAVLSPAEHLSYFSDRTLRQLLETVGFEDIRFERRYAGFGLDETMNANCTHAPGSRRQYLYKVFRRVLGQLLLPAVQAVGWGDTLLCSARAPEQND